MSVLNSYILVNFFPLNKLSVKYLNVWRVIYYIYISMLSDMCLYENLTEHNEDCFYSLLFMHYFMYVLSYFLNSSLDPSQYWDWHLPQKYSIITEMSLGGFL